MRNPHFRHIGLPLGFLIVGLIVLLLHLLGSDEAHPAAPVSYDIRTGLYYDGDFSATSPEELADIRFIQLAKK